jgi:hypothetical protein
MTSTSRTRSVAVAAAWVAAGALGATALTGLAVASPASTSTTGTVATAGSGTPTAADAAGRERLRERLRAFLHGEITVQGQDGPTEVALQRGEITAASASSVTVRSSDGFTTTYTVGTSTVVRRDRATVTADELEVGDTAFVRAAGSDATAIRALSPEGLAAAKQRIEQRGAGQGLQPRASAG